MIKQLKTMIDVEALEQYYRSLIHEKDGKSYISIQTMERIMLLEIYKSLCADAHDDINNGNHCGED